jgi:hypothetical protein
VETTNQMRPDLIVLTGDYVTQRADAILDMTPTLSRLEAPHGVYAILGNHDGWTDPEFIRNSLETIHISVLENSGTCIGQAPGWFYLAGLEDPLTGHPDLHAALAEAPEGITVIALVHDPIYVDILAGDGRVALQLSGHTHGGIVRFPGLGPVVANENIRKYDQGLFRVQDTWLYVNRGLGTVGLPVRCNCRPEITEITLTTESD